MQLCILAQADKLTYRWFGRTRCTSLLRRKLISVASLTHRLGTSMNIVGTRCLFCMCDHSNFMVFRLKAGSVFVAGLPPLLAIAAPPERKEPVSVMMTVTTAANAFATLQPITCTVASSPRYIPVGLHLQL